MLVTVAICTWNRARLLDQTLTRMRALIVPKGVSWELLVVNNNCSDETDEVLDKHGSHLPLRRLFESKQGLSNARNCASAAACGEITLWTDDDVLVHPEWLAAYVGAAQDWPNAAFFAGTISPWFSVQPPKWVRNNLPVLEGAFAIRQLGDLIRPLADHEHPFGANMAFRTEYLKRHLFDGRFGRFGKELINGEESVFINRLRAHGCGGVWVGSACVEHYIPKERLCTRFIGQWFRGHGRTMIRLGTFPEKTSSWWGAPRWMWKKYWIYRVIALCLSPLKTKTWFHSFRQAAYLRGMIEEKQSWRTAVGERTSSFITEESSGDGSELTTPTPSISR